MDNDLIDFPCSPDWQQHYYERGMTPRPGYPQDREFRLRILELERENERLRDRESRRRFEQQEKTVFKSVSARELTFKKPNPAAEKKPANLKSIEL